MKRYLGVLLIIMVSQLTFAQDEPTYVSTALTTMVLQRSPFFLGAGQIGTAVPMEDPLGFYFNPAQLGYFSQENNLATLFMPQKAKWDVGRGMSYYDNITLNSIGTSVGYNFKKYNIPLSVGIGYLHSKFDLGSIVQTDPFGPSPSVIRDIYDEFDCISLGAGLDYYVNFNIGFSIKPFTSHLGPYQTNNKIIFPSASGTAYDFGVLIITPVSRLVFNNIKYNLNDNSFLKPKFDLTIGYSLTNLGKKVWFVDPAQADPLPRTARLGYTLNFGVDLINKGMKINTIDYSFTAEAEDLLIKYNSNFVQEYQGIFGGINPIKHLIKLDDNRDVVVHRGNILRLFETLYITSGKYYGAGYNNIRSNGYGFSSEGIVKLLSASIDNNVLRYIANHVVIEYYDTNNFIDLFDTNFQGVAFNIKNIEI